jgi:hypothetical protein
LSSILKALRKIDEESPDLQSAPSLPRTFDARRSVNAHMRRRWFWVKIGSAVCIMTIMAAAGAFFLNHQQSIFSKPVAETSSTSKKDMLEMETPSEKSSVFRAKIAAESPQSAPGSPQTRQPVKKQPRALVPKEKIQKSGPATFELQPKPEIVRESPGTPAARMVPQAKTTDRKIPSPKMPKTDAPAAGSDTVKGETVASPPTPAADAYDRIDDSNLKLQALAWFDDASKRMAVINDRIVREGESVDGYQIIQIRQEDVVVRDGSKSWLLKFDLKQ